MNASFSSLLFFSNFLFSTVFKWLWSNVKFLNLKYFMKVSKYRKHTGYWEIVLANMTKKKKHNNYAYSNFWWCKVVEIGRRMHISMIYHALVVLEKCNIRFEIESIFQIRIINKKCIRNVSKIFFIIIIIIINFTCTIPGLIQIFQILTKKMYTKFK